MTFPQDFLIGVKKEEHYTDMLILTNDKKFIGRSVMKHHEDTNVIEVISAVARPTFGTLLYQSMAKYAFNQEKGIASSRDASTRGAALEIWTNFYKTINPNLVKNIPEYLNREVKEDLLEHEYKPYIHAYSLPTSSAFNNSLIDIKKHPESEDARALEKGFDESDEHFITSYDLDGSKWIDEEDPLPIDFTSKYPQQVELNISDILIDHDIFDAVKKDIENGKLSRTDAPIQCVIDIDGDIVFIDGHHRFVEAIIAGESEIEAVIEHNEYLHGFMEDVDRPNKNNLITQEEAVLALEELITEYNDNSYAESYMSM